MAQPYQPRTHHPDDPEAELRAAPTGPGPRLCAGLLAWYLLFVAVSCTAAPLFTDPAVSVALTVLQIPVCLWAVHRFTHKAAAAEATEPKRGQPWT